MDFPSTAARRTAEAAYAANPTEANRTAQREAGDAEMKEVLAAFDARQEATVTAAPEPVTEITVPGAFADWFTGTGVAQGQDDSDSECLALRLAMEASVQRTAGRSYYLTVTASTAVLEMLVEYAVYCIDANTDEPVPAELRAARTVRDRAREALARLGVAPAQQRTGGMI